MGGQTFNSKAELDNLFEIIDNHKDTTLPSEVLNLYTDLEQLLIRVHQMGYTSGYEKGVDFKNNLKDI